MNLDSIQNIELLRICTFIKMMELEKNKNNPNSNFTTTQHLREAYSNLFESFKTGDVDNIRYNLHETNDFSDFSQHIFEDNCAEIAKNYKLLAQSVLPKEKFDKIKRNF